MSYLNQLLNPPPTDDNKELHYLYLNSVHDVLQGLTSIRNDSIITNADFNNLSGKGLTPTTQADGDNEEFMADWKVFGASNATYTITPTIYPNNSTVKTSSDHFPRIQISSWNGQDLYIYQRQLASVRKYQKDRLTFNFWLKNEQMSTIKVRLEVYTYYDTATSLAIGKPIYVQSGYQQVASSISIAPINPSVGNGNYTEFRLRFLGLNNNTADISVYLLKGEFGSIATSL